jgi:hypothetical protein
MPVSRNLLKPPAGDGLCLIVECIRSISLTDHPYHMALAFNVEEYVQEANGRPLKDSNGAKQRLERLDLLERMEPDVFVEPLNPEP